jgi:VCBS repeat-containing protein
VTGFSVGGRNFAPGQAAVIAGVGTLTLNRDGSYSFTPAANYNGPVPAVRYTVADGEGGTDTSTLTLNVTPVNDPPVGTGTPVTTPEDTPVHGVVTATDPDGDPLTFTPGTPPAHGTVTINPDGSYTYVPNPDYNGPDSFTVTVSDGHGGTTTITVPVTVTPVNDVPEGTGTPVTTPEGTPVTGVVTAHDPDGDPLTFTPGTPPTHGTVTINPDGSYTYVPTPGYSGPDSFTVTVSDGHGGVTTITVPVTVTPVAQQEESHRDGRVPGPWFHKTFPELTPKQLGGITVAGIVVDTANGLNGLHSIIPGITADGIVTAAANTIEPLNNTPGDLSGDGNAIHNVVTSIDAWRPYSERLFGSDRDTADFDVAPFLGGAIRYDSGDESKAGFTIDTIVNRNLLYINVIPNGGEPLTLHITQPDGSPLPSWLGVSEKGVLVGDRTAGREVIDIKIGATAKDGTTIEKTVRINMHSGEILDITESVKSEARASFLTEDLDFELDHGHHEADALVRALASR